MPQRGGRAVRQTELPGELRIKPWARLTGPHPAAIGEIRGKRTAHRRTNQGPRNGRFRAYAIRRGVTKVDGSFVIDRVPPIPSSIQAHLHFATPSPLKSSQSVPLQLKPGETIDLTLGGNGSEISGQLVAENQHANFDYHFAINYLVAKRPGIEPPKTLTGKDFDWKRGWSDAWRATAEGQTYVKTSIHWFVKPGAGRTLFDLGSSAGRV